jgi:hypothetical protein
VGAIEVFYSDFQATSQPKPLSGMNTPSFLRAIPNTMNARPFLQVTLAIVFFFFKGKWKPLEHFDEVATTNRSANYLGAVTGLFSK